MGIPEAPPRAAAARASLSTGWTVRSSIVMLAPPSNDRLTVERSSKTSTRTGNRQSDLAFANLVNGAGPSAVLQMKPVVQRMSSRTLKPGEIRSLRDR